MNDSETSGIRWGTVLAGALAVLATSTAAWSAVGITQRVGAWEISFALPDGFGAVTSERTAPGYRIAAFSDGRYRILFCARPASGKEGADPEEFSRLVEELFPGGTFLPPSPGGDFGEGVASRIWMGGAPASGGNTALKPVMVVGRFGPGIRGYFFLTGHELKQGKLFGAMFHNILRSYAAKEAPSAGSWYRAGRRAVAPPDAPGRRDDSPWKQGSEVAVGQLGATGEGSTAMGETGWESFVTVTSTGNSKRLAEVPFRILWFQRQTAYKTLEIATDRQGNLYYLPLNEYDRTVWKYPDRSQRATETPIDGTHLSAALKKSGLRSAIYELKGFDGDRNGNLFIEVNLPGKSEAAYLGWNSKNGLLEMSIAPDWLHKTGNEGSDGEREVATSLRMAPTGPAAWICLQGRWSGQSLGMAYLFRSDEGGWRGNRIVPRVLAEEARPRSLNPCWGAPDWHGNWLFHDQGILWSMDRNGNTRPLVRIAIDMERVWYSNPVVLPNGDFWFAVNRDYSVNSYGKLDANGNFETTQIWAMVGDRSRWIRIRPKGKAAVEVREISGGTLIERLNLAGANLGGGVWATLRLKPDYASGGLAAWDKHHGLLFVVKPTD